MGFCLVSSETRARLDNHVPLLVSACLERMADHVTNIGERTRYIETGQLKELRGLRQVQYPPSVAIRTGFGPTCP